MVLVQTACTWYTQLLQRPSPITTNLPTHPHIHPHSSTHTYPHSQTSLWQLSQPDSDPCPRPNPNSRNQVTPTRARLPLASSARAQVALTEPVCFRWQDLSRATLREGDTTQPQPGFHRIAQRWTSITIQHDISSSTILHAARSSTILRPP